MDNNLIMFDVETQSTWPQIFYTSNSGSRAGQCLEFGRNTVATTWKFWRTLHPETVVMTNRNDKKTTIKPEWYNVNPYKDYHERIEPILHPITNVDPRLPDREVVLGVHGDGGSAAVLVQREVAHATIGKSPVVFFSGAPTTNFFNEMPVRTTFVFENNLEGEVRRFRRTSDDTNGLPRFEDIDSGTVWSIEGIGLEGPLAGKRLAQMPALHLYWFAWATFFPNNPILHLRD